jgi:hypothetical protein
MMWWAHWGQQLRMETMISLAGKERVHMVKVAWKLQDLVELFWKRV